MSLLALSAPVAVIRSLPPRGGPCQRRARPDRRTVENVAADADLEQRLDHLSAALDALFQAVDALANNVPALANSRGPLDEIRRDLAEVAVALKAARQT